MVFMTGDIHGTPRRVCFFSHRLHLSRNDTIIIAGDVGANYYLNERDEETKRKLASVNPTVLCVHGNHECRPEHISSYHLIEWNGGLVWVEDKYPNLLFAKDGEIYTIEGQRYLVIGGAFSIDWKWRVNARAGWWADEQPSQAIKAFVEAQIGSHEVDIVVSHTCPRKYEPTEVFLPGYEQSQVDKSTENWLDTIEEKVSYRAWYCGHWHTAKRIDKMHFMFENWETIEKEVADEQ